MPPTSLRTSICLLRRLKILGKWEHILYPDPHLKKAISGWAGKRFGSKVSLWQLVGTLWWCTVGAGVIENWTEESPWAVSLGRNFKKCRHAAVFTQKHQHECCHFVSSSTSVSVTWTRRKCVANVSTSWASLSRLFVCKEGTSLAVPCRASVWIKKGTSSLQIRYETLMLSIFLILMLRIMIWLFSLFCLIIWI